MEKDKKDAQEKIAKLKDERETLMKKFEEMKYSGEQKMSEGQRVIETAEDGSQKEESRKDNSRSKSEKSKRLLVQVKSDIEHLANKVHHLVGFGPLQPEAFEVRYLERGRAEIPSEFRCAVRGFRHPGGRLRPRDRHGRLGGERGPEGR